jgi:hypothetical protein
LLRQQGDQSLPEQEKVVHHENSNGLAHLQLSFPVEQ